MERAEEASNLSPREYVAVFLMLLMLSTLGILSFTSRSMKQDLGVPLSIHVVGEVNQEQVVQVPQGAQVADVLAQVHFTSSADLEKMSHDAPVSQGQILVIPRKGSLSVYVKGAVAKSEVLFFEEGATFLDLQESVKLDQKADRRAFFRKKRALKDGEIVCVQFKK